MAYQFPPDVEKLVREKMQKGDYRSEDDLLRDALRAFEGGGRPHASLSGEDNKPHPLIGLLKDVPELADEILSSAMKARETRPQRLSGEEVAG